MIATVSGITRYPAKSMAGVELATALIEPRGLQHDRRFMLVDEDGSFLTARKHPDMLRVTCHQEGWQVLITAPGVTAAKFAFDGKGLIASVMIWQDQVKATAVSTGADAWFSSYLGFPCQLVFMGPDSHRPVDPAYGQPSDEVSFADGYPILIIAQASLDALNARLDQPLGMRRFRPNLVLSHCPAYAEDDWRLIRIGNDVELELVKHCSRCVLTTLDPETGERHPDKEPLRTLATYRRGEGGKVNFGMNAIPRRTGQIKLGDSVSLLK